MILNRITSDKVSFFGQISVTCGYGLLFQIIGVNVLKQNEAIGVGDLPVELMLVTSVVSAKLLLV